MQNINNTLWMSCITASHCEDFNICSNPKFEAQGVTVVNVTVSVLDESADSLVYFPHVRPLTSPVCSDLMLMHWIMCDISHITYPYSHYV